MLKKLLILSFGLSLNQFVNCMDNNQENSKQIKGLETENDYSDNKTKVDLLKHTELLPDIKNIINEYYQEWEFYKSIEIGTLSDCNPNSLAFSSDNKCLAYTQAPGRTVRRKKQVAIVNIEQEKLLETYDLSSYSAQIFFTNNDNNLIIAEDGKNIKIIDKNTSKLLGSIKNRADISVTITGNSKYLALPGRRNQALIFDTKNFESRTFNFSPDPTKKMLDFDNRLLFSPDGNLLAYGSEFNVLIGNVALNKTLYHIQDIFIGRLFSFSFDSKYLATISAQSIIKIWNMENGNLVKEIDNNKFETQKDDDFNPIYSLAFSPTQMILATGHEDGKVKIWNPIAGNLIQTIYPKNHRHEQALSLKFSKNGKYLAYILRQGSQIVILKSERIMNL